MKIGIIGAGVAGLASAWLLEDTHEVIVFEKSSICGGHAQTVYVPHQKAIVPIEVGFEFFNARMYPRFCKLLEILNVEISPFDFTYTFYKPQKQLLVLPPIQHGRVFWQSFTPNNLYNLIQLQRLISKSTELMKSKNGLITLDEFAHEYHISQTFMDQFFLPLFSAGWGVSAQEFKNFSAYNVLAYIVKNKPIGLKPSVWYEITQGMSHYMETFLHQLQQACVHTSTAVEKISYDSNNYEIKTNTGQTFVVDHVIIATDPYSAPPLLQSIDQEQKIYNAVSKIEFIPTTIAVHNDTRFLAPRTTNWSVANVTCIGNFSTLTIYKQWKGVDLFRSWMLPGFPTPRSVYATQEYYHPKPNVNYFKAQQIIAQQQGKNNLWIAGLYTRDIDAHESALVSAIEIAQKLAPNSVRLQTLLN